MSLEMSNAERDELWLFERMAQDGAVPNDQQIDFFVEKVAEICAEGLHLLDEGEARNMAYGMLP